MVQRSRRIMKVGFGSKTAAYVAGVSAMLEIVPCITILLDRLVRADNDSMAISHAFRIIIYVSFGMYSMLALTSLLFLVGMRLNKKSLFVPWMVVLVFLTTFEVAAIMVHKRGNISEALHKWELVFIISFTVRLVVNIVSLIIAMYQYKDLANGHDRHDIIISRQVARRANESRRRNLTTVTHGRLTNLPGVTLTEPPPYLEKPPSYVSGSPPPSYCSEPCSNPLFDLIINLPQGGVDGHRTAPPFIPAPDYSICGEDGCSNLDYPADDNQVPCYSVF